MSLKLVHLRFRGVGSGVKRSIFKGTKKRGKKWTKIWDSPLLDAHTHENLLRSDWWHHETYTKEPVVGCRVNNNPWAILDSKLNQRPWCHSNSTLLTHSALPLPLLSLVYYYITRTHTHTHTHMCAHLHTSTHTHTHTHNTHTLTHTHTHTHTYTHTHTHTLIEHKLHWFIVETLYRKGKKLPKTFTTQNSILLLLTKNLKSRIVHSSTHRIMMH
jgi:hypothetical protein